MSSRVLKKLSVKIQEPEIEDEELESDSDLVIPTKKQLNINRYDLVRKFLLFYIKILDYKIIDFCV